MRLWNIVLTHVVNTIENQADKHRMLAQQFLTYPSPAKKACNYIGVHVENPEILLKCNR